MLSNANLSNGFWAEVVAIVADLIDRPPNRKLDSKVAKEIWFEKPSLYRHFWVFGCEAFCHVLKHLRDKLAPNSKKYVFLGYGKPSEMQFCLWDLEPKKILYNSDIYFNEHKMHTKPIKTIEIQRVVFQEDVQIYNQQLPKDNGQNASQREEQ